MYVLTKGHVVIGYYDTQAEATAALIEEYDKEDGVELAFRRLEDVDDGQESEIRY